MPVRKAHAEYVREALDVLEVVRIDHGNNALADADLVAELVRRRIPLTVCPLSNVKLRVVDDITAHPLKRMLDLGLLVTVNSDDPAYFGGYVNENYLAVAHALNLDRSELVQLARNSFEASLLDADSKSALDHGQLDAVVGTGYNIRARSQDWLLEGGFGGCCGVTSAGDERGTGTGMAFGTAHPQPAKPQFGWIQKDNGLIE